MRLQSVHLPLILALTWCFFGCYCSFPMGPISGPDPNSFSSHPSVVLLGAVDGRLLAIDAADGSFLWVLDTGGPMISSTGQIRRQPFIPSLSGDTTLFQLSGTGVEGAAAGGPTLRRLPVTLETLLRPGHVEHQGDLLLTSKENQYFEVDPRSGKLLGMTDTCGTGVAPLRVVRYDIVTRGINSSSSNGWSYTVGGLLLSLAEPRRAASIPGGLEDAVVESCSSLSADGLAEGGPLLPLPSADLPQGGEDYGTAESRPEAAVVVACQDGVVRALGHSGEPLWEHHIDSRLVTMHLLSAGGQLSQQPLFLPPSRLLLDTSEEESFGSPLPPKSPASCEQLRQRLALQPPSVVIGNFSGLQYALVSAPECLPTELVPSPLLQPSVATAPSTPLLLQPAATLSFPGFDASVGEHFDHPEPTHGAQRSPVVPQRHVTAGAKVPPALSRSSRAAFL
eukprot:RCo005319